MNYGASLLAAVVSLLITTSVANGQVGNDEWLSHSWSTPSPLPVDVRMQSAARVGARTLVAWGTVMRGDNDSLGPIIVAQIVNGVQTIGAPFVVHSKRAIPSTVVATVDLDSAFTILWNDERADKPGVYRRRISLERTAIDTSESFVSSQRLVSDRAVWLVREHDALWIQWRFLKSGEYYVGSLPVDQTGAVLDTPSIIPTVNFDDTLYLRSFPGCRIIGARNGTARWYNSDGTVDPRELPISNILRPHYILPDTSLYALRWMLDTGLQFERYASVFDTVPQQSRYIEGRAVHRQLGSITKDTVGRVNAWYSLRTGDEKYSSLDLVCQPMSDSGTTKDTAIWKASIHSWITTNSPSIRSDGGCDALPYVPGDDNSSKLQFHRYSFSSALNGSVERFSDTAIHLVVGSGRYTRDGDLLATPAGHDTRHRVPLQRDSLQHVSTIHAVIDSQLVTLVAPSAWNEAFSHARLPVLVQRDQRLFVVTRDGSSPPVYSQREWFADGSESTPLVGAVTFPVGYRVDGRDFSEVLAVSERYAALNDGAGILCGEKFAQDYHPGYSGWGSSYGYVPTSGGFVRTPSAGGMDAIPNVLLASYDPNLGQSVLYFHMIAPKYGGPWKYPRICMYGMGNNMDTAWSVLLPLLLQTNERQVVAVSPQRVIVVAADSLYIVSSEGVSQPVGILTHPPDAKYDLSFRLYGRLIVRLYPRANPESTGLLNDSVVNVALLDTSGLLVDSISLRTPPGYYRPAPVDFGMYRPIALLWGSDSGLRLTLVDRHLKLLIADTIISAGRHRTRYPSAVARGDTLFVVWEDARHGTTDIFGNSWVLPEAYRTPITDSTPPDGTPIAFMLSPPVPNPVTRGSILFTVTCPEKTTVRLDLYVVLGRRIAILVDGVLERGFTDVVVPSASLHPGAYFAIARRGGDSPIVRRVVVAR